MRAVRGNLGGFIARTDSAAVTDPAPASAFPNDAPSARWIVPDGSPVANYAFDVTPARLVSGLVAPSG